MIEQTKNYIAACYARLSVDDMQDGTSVSIDTQVKILEDYCKENGIAIYDFYCDDGYTGTNFNRPNFQRLLQDAEKRQFNMVVVKDLSRLGREYIGVGQYIEEYFPERNIRFVAIGDDYDSREKKNDLDFIVPMKNLFNQWYPAECSRKVRQALKAKAARGEYIGSHAAYGLQKVKDNIHTLEFDDAVAPNVIRIFTLIAYEGYGYTKIAKTFKKEKILTPSAYRAIKEEKPYDKDPYDWNLATVSAIVHNEIYLGTLVSGRREKLSFKNKKVIKKDRQDCIVVEDIVPALISQTLWDDAHSRIAARKRTTTSGFDNIFAGLIKCDKCGRALGFSSKKDRTPYYCCETYKKKGSDVCSSHYTIYDEVYEAVLTNLQGIFYMIKNSTANFSEQIAATIMSEDSREKPNYDFAIEELQKQIKKIDQRYEQMYQDRLDGIISVQKFKELTTNDEEKQAKLQEGLRELIAKKEAVESSRDSIDFFVEKVKEFGDITSLDRTLLNTLVEKIVVGDRTLVDGEYVQNIKIHYKFLA